MYNTAVGFDAGNAVTTGTYNTLVGGLAGDAIVGGYRNVGFGGEALGACIEGYNNTACGYDCMSGVTSGYNNVGLGRWAGTANGPGGVVTTENNQLVLGDGNTANAHVQVDWTVASDARDKTDFTALDLGLDFVNALAPVTYKWDKRINYVDATDPAVDLNTVTTDGTHKEDWLDIGFKAQEVEALEIAAGYKIADKTNLTTSLTGDGKQYGLQYSKFVPILVKAVQELSAEVEELKQKAHDKCEEK